MSSGNLVIPENRSSFMWSEDLHHKDFLFAEYHVGTISDGVEAAIGMAMEQSASTLAIEGYVEPHQVLDWSIRVKSVESLSVESRRAVDPYFLDTEVYGNTTSNDIRHLRIELAIPLCLFQNQASQLLNVLVGELPRLGYLTHFRLHDIRFSQPFGPGPAFGQKGILDLLGLEQGPLLCRAMRPGVGLDTPTMARLNRDVLTGGFHLVKDDELICFATDDQFRQHVQAMIVARDEAMQTSGERKLYLANLFCDPQDLQSRWDIACELGVDGVLVAPVIQGFGILSWIAKQKQLPVIAHNSGKDLLTRNMHWGIEDAVMYKFFRHLGADWFVTPGTFCTPAISEVQNERIRQAVFAEEHGLLPMMPNVQGGKHPGGLGSYCRAVGNRDFMLIVAHWVDNFPDGLMQGAREFRNAIDRLEI